MLRKLLFAGIGLVVLILLAGCGRPYWRGSYLRGERPSERVLGRFDREVGKLNLTESQKKQYEEIESKVKARAEVIRKEREETLEKVKGEFEVARSISWLTALKVAIFVALLAGLAGVRRGKERREP